MKIALLVFQLVVLFVSRGQSSLIPSAWKTCKRNDPNLNSCLKEGIASALANLLPGNPDFNIRPLDPLYLKNATFVLDEPEVKMTISFSDVHIVRFIKNIRVDSVESNWKTMTVKLFVPEGITAKCICHIAEGSIFMGRPISGEGPCQFDYGNVVLNWKLKFVEKDKDGVTFYNVDDFDFQIDADKMSYKFTNLYNGDSEKTEEIEKLTNDNWKVFWEALRHGIRKVMGSVGKHSSNKIFTAVSKNEISPP